MFEAYMTTHILKYSDYKRYIIIRKVCMLHVCILSVLEMGKKHFVKTITVEFGYCFVYLYLIYISVPVSSFTA